MRTSALEVVATDVRPEIVACASRTAAEEPLVRGQRLAACRRIDEPTKSFDVVHASLVLHHLDPAAAIGAACARWRVSRARAVIVNDLDRGRHWLLGARS